MLFTDIHELKAVLDIPEGDRSEDKKLLFLVEQASSWIEEIVGRPGMSYRQRTEFYDAPGTHLLPLRSRPVYATPAIQVFVDRDGYYGAASGSFAASDALTYGTDFALKIDQDDGVRSRSGLLVRLNDVWQRPVRRELGRLSPFLARDRGSIKVVYYGGYTVDDLPAAFRLACNLLVARLRSVLPLGVETSSESYEERSITAVTKEKNKLLALVTPILFNYRNWHFGG